jgi:formiminotetrahydrofolate cyclodeaminase
MDELNITRDRNFGWRYTIKGNILGVKINFEQIDPENYEVTMQEVTKIISLVIQEKEQKL